MKTLVIGDPHGCYEELLDLLDKAGLGSDDQIISIGDLVDRGSDSAKVLDFFRTTPNATSIMGNHERKHVRWQRGEIEPAASQIITRAQIGETDYPAAVAYMDSLPRYLDLPDALLVHGFYEPGVLVEQQRENVIVGTLGGEGYLRERYSWPWYEHYDGEKPLIVGHRDYSDGLKMQPVVYKDRVFMIDTRCVYGGSLTGLLLPDFKLISVPSRGDHWADMLREYADIVAGYEGK
ncbi:MAG: metallophosphoesterase [Anaerolineae bacterium]